jgi:hypothetical protein
LVLLHGKEKLFRARQRRKATWLDEILIRAPRSCDPVHRTKEKAKGSSQVKTANQDWITSKAIRKERKKKEGVIITSRQDQVDKTCYELREE